MPLTTWETDASDFPHGSGRHPKLEHSKAIPQQPGEEGTVHGSRTQQMKRPREARVHIEWKMKMNKIDISTLINAGIPKMKMQGRDTFVDPTHTHQMSHE